MKRAAHVSAELESLRAEVERLRASYEETHEVALAIHGGEVDAVVVHPSDLEPAVYTLFGADHPYRMLVEAMTEGAVTLARDGVILYCNPSFAQMVRSDASEVAGTCFSRYVHPSDASRFQAFLSRDADERAEMTLLATDGTKVPAYLSRSVADLVGVSGICLIVTDLTEQEKHREVVASERLARSILEQASEAIVVCDEQGRITHASRQAVVLCGHNPLLMRFDEAYPLVISHGRSQEKDGAALEASKALLLEAACGKRLLGRREVTYTRPDGQRVHLLLSNSLVTHDDGKLLGTVLILADMTGARRAAEAIEASERKLRLANETLEQRVADRTRMLRHANEALSLKNRELQDFAYLASHDLQEPLRKITTFIDLFVQEEDDSLSENGRFYAGRIAAAAERMSDLLHSLLDYSRVATEGVKLREIDLNDILEEVQSDLDIAMVESQCSLVAEDLPSVAGDPVQMRRLFTHLIANAIKFCRKDVPPRIQIRCSVSASDAPPSNGSARTVRLEFEDNGAGFEEKHRDKIFAPFQRLHGRTYPGTGMGLAICRRIVERHFGTIEARSTPEEGSTFIITLPLSVDAETGSPTEARQK